MKKEAKNTLRLFQCDYNRRIEEDFAQVLTENEKVRLFFINENDAYTDGRNIVVDPAMGEVFADVNALCRTEDYLRLGRLVSNDMWFALRMIVRGQNIHECLHVLYTDFPLKVKDDSRSTSKARLKALALIANIIEDSFIEAAGCSVFDNLELYLKFHRVALLFTNTPIDGTVDSAFSKEISQAMEPLPLAEYLDYMATFLLYPMIWKGEPPETIASYVAQTKQLFLDGSACGNPKERFIYAQRIFDIIESLIPQNEENIDDRRLIKMLSGIKTHAAQSKTINEVHSKGRQVNIARRLFLDINGNMLDGQDFSGQVSEAVKGFAKDKTIALKIIMAVPITIEWIGGQFDCASIHKNITIIETKPKPNLNLKKAYQNIYNKYHININAYNSRFTQLLKAKIPVREEKRLFGSGITSTRLADVKKRYWYSNAEDYGVPDIAVLLLIDGSGSMEGARRESAMISSVILHEVLKKQNITHAIVEHRAVYDKPCVKHNILIDFSYSDEEKYNILSLKADDGTREGLSLYWAEQYLASKTVAENKLIIVLSDGLPTHGVDGDGCYLPPVSIKDTANAASKIMKRGTKIIAVALDDNDSEGACYELLKDIYPVTVDCSDLRRLTGQLLEIVSKQLV